jgi:hypothetical protein
MLFFGLEFVVLPFGPCLLFGACDLELGSHWASAIRYLRQPRRRKSYASASFCLTAAGCFRFL